MRDMLLPPPHAPVRFAGRLERDQSFTLDQAAMKSLAFRQVNVKEAFTVLDAEGQFFRASLKAATETSGQAVAYEKLRGSPESPARITLLCAVLARQRMIVVTQKATELGCVQIAPVFSEHSVKRGALDHEKPWAWPGQAIKGAKQCRRAIVPRVLPVEPLERALGAPYWKDAHARYVLDDRADDTSDPFPPPNEPVTTRDIVLAIGPEGGWSDAERELLAKAGATPLALGSRVLRAETAVFAGVSVLQHRLGDLRAGT